MANKIDIHGSEKSYKASLIKLKKDVSPRNYKILINFLEDLKLGLVGKSKRPNIRTLTKILFRLKVVCLYMDKMNKPIYPINLNYLKKFIGDLQEDEIKKRFYKKGNKSKGTKGKWITSSEGYSPRIKVDIKVEYIRFLKYKMGETDKFKKLTSWIDLTEERKDIVFFRPEEIKKVISYSPNLEDKTIISVLMDSGLRIEECLNIRYSDIRQDGEDWIIDLKNEYSKTMGRVIYLFEEDTKKYLKEYLEKNPSEDSNKAIFRKNYNSYRMMLNRLGKKVLGKPIKPHDLRRSSATNLAQHMNNYQMCERFGWVITSASPQKYICKSGINQKKIVKKLEQESLSSLREELDQVKRDNQILKQGINDFEENLNLKLGAFLTKVLEGASNKKQEETLQNLNECDFSLKVIPQT